MAAAKLICSAISLTFIAMTILCSSSLFAAGLYFTRDNYIERGIFSQPQSFALSDDNQVELLCSHSDYAICTTSTVARQLMQQSSAHYMVNPGFKSGCFVSSGRFSHSVNIPHSPVQTSIDHCFLVNNKESAVYFLTLWDDKESTVTSTSSGHVKYLRLEINDQYLEETGTEYTSDGGMICKTITEPSDKSFRGLLSEISEILTLLISR